MKQHVRLVALLALMMLPMGVMGQVTLVSDNASNYGGTWSNSSNFGFGLSAWDNTYGANTGGFIGNPSNNGMGTSGIGTTAFGMFATGAAYMNARRPFATPMKVGDVLTFYWAINWDANGGAKGFDLKSGATTVININNGGSSTITSTNGTADGSYGTNPMLVTLTRTSSSEYSFTMTRRSDGSTYSTTISSSLAVDRLEFYIGGQNEGNGNRNMYFNSITITNPSATTSISNAAGWRLMSSPVSTTVGDLFDEVWTQGMTGSDSPSSGASNIRGFNPATSAYYSITNVGDELGTNGILYYHFNDDNYDGTPNSGPTTLSVTGTENVNEIGYTSTWSSGTQYSIAGNPYATTIDWDLVGKGAGVSATAWVYDRNISNYVSWNGTTGALTNGLIAPFQGFWIEYTSAANTVTFEYNDKTTGATFYRKDVNPFVVALEGASGEFKSAAYIEFEQSGDLGKGPKDALAFVSLSPEHLTLSTVLDEKSYSINHLPLLNEVTELPLDLQFTEGGLVALSTKQLNLPIGWAAFIRDNETGSVRQLTADFTMDVTLPVMKASARNPLDLNGNPVMLAATSPRFTLIIDPASSTSTKDDGRGTMDEFALSQNYPNPFNPSTQIRFTLQSSDVTRLTVYDVLGREVAVLVNGTLAAGAHSVTFDASNLTSGVYLYKLEAGGMSMTKRMTLVK